MKKKKVFWGLLFLVLVLMNIISLCFLLFCSFSLQTNGIDISTGKVQISVFDNMTMKPIDNATVCIVDTMSYFQTDKNGKTEIISVPILRDIRFDNAVMQSWGKISILVYKSGYADHISFDIAISHNTTRVGLNIYLNPIINPTDNKPSISIEEPFDLWIDELIKHYKRY